MTAKQNNRPRRSAYGDAVPRVGRQGKTKIDRIWELEVGERIRAARFAWERRTGLGIVDLAELAGISYSILYCYERASRGPSAINLAKIAAAMEIPAGRLLPPWPPKG